MQLLYQASALVRRALLTRRCLPSTAPHAVLTYSTPSETMQIVIRQLQLSGQFKSCPCSKILVPATSFFALRFNCVCLFPVSSIHISQSAAPAAPKNTYFLCITRPALFDTCSSTGPFQGLALFNWLHFSRGIYTDSREHTYGAG